MGRLSILVGFLCVVNLDVWVSQANGSCCSCGATDVADTTAAEVALPERGREVVAPHGVSTAPAAAPAPVFLDGGARVAGADEWLDDAEEEDEPAREAAAANPDDPADGDAAYTDRQVARYWLPVQVTCKATNQMTCKATKACFFFREGEFLYLNAEVSSGAKFVESSDFVAAFRQKGVQISSDAFTDEEGYPLNEQEIEILLAYLRDNPSLTQADVKRLLPDSPVLEGGSVSAFAAAVATMLSGTNSAPPAAPAL